MTQQNNHDNSTGIIANTQEARNFGNEYKNSGYEFNNVDTVILNSEKSQQILQNRLNLDQMRPSLDCWEGRTMEIKKIRGWLADDTTRLIGITGLGGFGKSTLAAKIYEDESTEFEKKFWADVTRKVTFTELARRILLQLEIPKESVEAIPELSLVGKLVNQLREGKYLLVIDNLESLLKEDGQWSDNIYKEFFQAWFDFGGKSKILVTTRERPQLREIKSQWRSLLGLQATEGASLLKTLGILGTDAELEEFVEKAQGYPLILKLVAGFLREEEELNPQISYLQKHGLADASQLLTEDKLKGVHRGVDIWMRQVFDASFNRLSDKLQRLILNISVYRVPFNLAAASAQLPDEEVSEHDLRQVVRRSLLQEELDEDGEKFYQFHPLLWEYIKKKAGDLTQARQRAIKYYESSGETPLNEVFYHYLELEQYDLASELLDTVQEALEMIGQNSLLAELYEKLLQKWRPVSPENNPTVAWALTHLGTAYASLKQYYKAIDYHQESLKIFKELGERNGEASALTHIGQAYNSLGESQQAIEYFQKTLATFRQIRQRHNEAVALSGLGNAYNTLKEYQKAIDFHQQSLDIRCEIGDSSGEAASLSSLGNTYYSLGEYQKAIDYYQQSLVIERKIGDRSGEAASLGSLGNAYHSLGEYQKAIDHYQKSLAIRGETGDRSGEAASLGSLGNAYHSLGEYQKAIDYEQQSLDISREINDRSGEGGSLCNLAHVYKSLEQYELAINYYQQALLILQKAGHREFELNTLRGLGDTYFCSKQYQQSIDCDRKCLGISKEIGDRSGEADSLNNLGLAYNSLKEYQKAIDYYQQSLDIRREIGDRRGEANTLQLLAQLYYLAGRFNEGFAAGNQAAQTLIEIGKFPDDLLFPKPFKSIIKFAQSGKGQLILCFIFGLVAFPFALICFLGLILWRIIRAQSSPHKISNSK